MDYRQGTCSSCKNSFRVPATFTANKARCPKCKGVVEIGPVAGAASSDASGAAPSSASSAAPSSARPVPASVPPPKPAAASAPAAPLGTAKPAPTAPRPAAGVTPRSMAPAGAKDSVRSAAEAAAARVKTGATRPGATASAKHDSAGKDDKGGDGEPGHHRHHHEPKKKRSPLPALLGFALLAVLAGVGYWYFGIYQPAQDAAHAKVKSEADARRAAERVKADAELNARNAATDAEQAAKAAAAAAAASDDAGAQASAPKVEVAKPEAEIVDDIVLTDFPEQSKLATTSDEDWQQLVEWARLYTDSTAGAAGNRARNKLFAKGKEAFPALLNRFRVLDLTSEDGKSAGDLIQKLLREICNGNNFDWRYTTELKDVVFNKKAIRSWFKAWDQARDSDVAWGNLAKLNKKPAAGEGDAPADKPKEPDDDF